MQPLLYLVKILMGNSTPASLAYVMSILGCQVSGCPYNACRKSGWATNRCRTIHNSKIDAKMPQKKVRR